MEEERRKRMRARTYCPAIYWNFLFWLSEPRKCYLVFSCPSKTKFANSIEFVFFFKYLRTERINFVIYSDFQSNIHQLECPLRQVCYSWILIKAVVVAFVFILCMSLDIQIHMACGADTLELVYKMILVIFSFIKVTI